MVAEVKISDPVDPLHGCSLISLLPRTYRGGSSKTAISEQHGDMEFIQSYLKSVTIECPDKCLEQAKIVLSSTSELQNSEFPCLMPSEDKDTMIPGKGKDRPQERRPALGRKRAQFSLKPNTSSQPPLDENVSLNIDQFQDPEEFYSAYEKLENAKKELQKQRGDVSTDLTKDNTSMIARSRRPGILGKTVGYKHRYSSVPVNRDEAVLSSQGNFEADVSIQSNTRSNIEMTDQHAQSKERELASHGPIDAIQGKDSVTKEGKTVISILDEMLSTNCTDLDENGAVTFLQDRLQIKPMNLDKLRLPKLDGIRRSDFKAPDEQLGGPRKALSDIHNKLKRVSSKKTTEVQQVMESSLFQSGSPTPPRSPFSALTLLKKRISQMDPPVNPFSFRGIGISPARQCSSVEGLEKHDVSPNNDFDHNDANDTTSAELNCKELTFAGQFESLMLKEDNTAGSNMISKKLVTENLACHEMPMDDGSSGLSMDKDIRSSVSESDKHEVPPHFDYVRNDAYDSTSAELNGKGLNFSGKFQYPILQEGNTLESNMVSGKLVAEVPACPPEITMDDGSNGLNTDMDITLSGSDGDKHEVSPGADYDHNDLTGTSSEKPDGKGLNFSGMFKSPILEEDNTAGTNMVSGKLVTENLTCPLGMPTDDNSNSLNSDMDIRSSGSDGVLEDKDEETQQEAVASEQPELDFEGLPKGNMDYSRHQLDQSDSIAVGEHHPEDGYSRSLDIPPEKDNETCEEPSGISMNERSKQKTPRHSGSKRKEISRRKSLSGRLVTGNSACPPELSIDENSNRFPTDLDISSSRSGDMEDLTQQESARGGSMSDRNEHEASPHNRRKRKEIANRKSQSGKQVIENSACPPEMSMDENSNRFNRSSGFDGVEDQTHEESSKISMHEKSEQEAPPRNRRKRKQISNRKSLAGAGTVFDDGRRKSTRIRTRPLEYWKGERFLYGRVHETLLTVIGVKTYESPASAKGKGKKRKVPTFKVESFVSDEYKELVEQAALH